MKKFLFTAVTCASLIMTTHAFSAETASSTTSSSQTDNAKTTDEKPKKEVSEKQKKQRAKMGQCAKTAKEQSLKGDARKAFMKECLSNKGKK